MRQIRIMKQIYTKHRKLAWIFFFFFKADFVHEQNNVPYGIRSVPFIVMPLTNSVFEVTAFQYVDLLFVYYANILIQTLCYDNKC